MFGNAIIYGSNHKESTTEGRLHGAILFQWNYIPCKT